MKFIITIALTGFCILAHAQTRIQPCDTSTFVPGEGVALSRTSFRGLSVVNDLIVWASGSRGTVARSTDGGKTFEVKQLKGYERSDFRDIEAFDEDCAVVMSSGTPAYLLKTTDGGQTWKEVYRNTDSAYFLDAMDFWNKRTGMVVGDPVNGRFVLLQTRNGGDTWQEPDTAHRPQAIAGEAVFAASGTSLRCLKGRQYAFVTGGAASRVLIMNRNSRKHTVQLLHLVHGESSQGAFSFARTKRSGYWLFAGGDYQNDTQTTAANFDYTRSFGPGGRITASENLHGYKSCIEIVEEKYGRKSYGYPYVIATGTSGTESGRIVCTFLSSEFRFHPIGEGYHVVRKAKKGRTVFLAGSGGRIAKLVR